MGCCKEISKRQIIVVTGANGGLGFGICHRLLLQLSQPNPPDAIPCVNPFRSSAKLDDHNAASNHPPAPTTIIMACRNRGRAETARAELYDLLDRHISTFQAGSQSYHYALEFQQRLEITIHILDLSDIHSVLRFGKEVSRQYPYISHLICNAGLATYSHLDLRIFIAQFYQSPLIAVSNPKFNVQNKGFVSGDKLGLVWQSNVFGHYVLFRCLEPLLSAYSQSADPSFLNGASRVLWMSSVDSHPAYDPETDWQLINTHHSYQASKFQIDLLALELARRAEKAPSARGKIRHLLVTPGVTVTSIAALLLDPWPLKWLMILFFYFTRILGSPHVSFTVFKAAVSAVHLTLVDLAYIPTVATERASPTMPKFTTMSNRWGTESVGASDLGPWPEHPEEGALLLDRCERLYQTFVEAEAEREEEAEVEGRIAGS